MMRLSISFSSREQAEGAVDSLLSLPADLSPKYFGESEDIEGSEQIEDPARFASFCREHPEGYFLLRADATYSMNLAAKIPSMTLYLTKLLNDELVDICFQALSTHEPVFGFCAVDEEYRHRNRLSVRIGKNSAEAWIGRDLERWIPGLYWTTLLSMRHCRERGLDLDSLLSEPGTSAIVLQRDLWLLRFYEMADQWLDHVERLDGLCARYAGIVPAPAVRAAAEQIHSLVELKRFLLEWK